MNQDNINTRRCDIMDDFIKKVAGIIDRTYLPIGNLAKIAVDGLIHRIDHTKRGDRAIWINGNTWEHEGIKYSVFSFGSFKDGAVHTVKSWEKEKTQTVIDNPLAFNRPGGNEKFIEQLSFSDPGGGYIDVKMNKHSELLVDYSFGLRPDEIIQLYLFTKDWVIKNTPDAIVPPGVGARPSINSGDDS